MRKPSLCLLAAGLLAITGQMFSLEIEASTLVNLSDEEKEEFLLHAKVMGCKEIPVGITRPQRCTLSDGRLTHDAHFQTVDIYKPEFETILGREINFRDCYKFNIAAYRLDRLLNLNMVPVSVERRVGGRTGAMTWWIDDVQMRERERRRKRITPPDQVQWNNQMYRVRVFHQLIYDTDPNLTNVLITKDWTLRIVDFTRAFRMHSNLKAPENLVRIDRGLLERLRDLDRETLMRDLSPNLTNAEIDGLLARRDRIVKLFGEKLTQEGEAAVLYDL